MKEAPTQLAFCLFYFSWKAVNLDVHRFLSDATKLQSSLSISVYLSVCLLICLSIYGIETLHL